VQNKSFVEVLLMQANIHTLKKSSIFCSGAANIMAFSHLCYTCKQYQLGC